MGTPSHHDSTLAALAAFACNTPLALDAATAQAAKSALMDCLAVALGALRHRAAQAARRYARNAPVAAGATLWGSGERVSAEAATMVNGVPLRGYDYNDLYIGRSGGHPSDIIPGAIALAQWRGLSGQQLLSAIALGYEAQLSLFDCLSLHANGWDYPVVTGIGATCGYARLLGLSEAQTREALAITAISHFVSDEVESGELNARGDLTMWKRFNASNAARTAVSACLLAEAGVEGAVRPFEGKTAFFSKLGLANADVPSLLDRLGKIKQLSRVGDVTFKRWPVGSRAQSAIQAALEARAALVAAGGDPWELKHIRVLADAEVYEHLVGCRAAPFHPVSRETADHSLPYVVTAAVLDGQVKTDAFSEARVLEKKRLDILAGKVKAEPSKDLSKGAAAGFLSRVEITDATGKIFIGEAKAPPGHRLQPFGSTDFEQKLRENVEPLFGGAAAARIVQEVWSLDAAAKIDGLCAQLVLGDARSIDGAPAD